jgi:hypothetical protein
MGAGALLTALVPILALALGTSSATILSGLTIAQWVAIAAAIVNLIPSLPAVVKEIEALHPIFKKLIADAEQFGAEVAGSNAAASAQAIVFGYEDPANPGLTLPIPASKTE